MKFEELLWEAKNKGFIEGMMDTGCSIEYIEKSCEKHLDLPINYAKFFIDVVIEELIEEIDLDVGESGKAIKIIDNMLKLNCSIDDMKKILEKNYGIQNEDAKNLIKYCQYYDRIKEVILKNKHDDKLNLLIKN